ncbi:MAG: hypothetical protein COU29_00400 [Candidatus Magasanikbacteria bacterium CG10_big_fil_rev_8_21_14_0_10_36_32]|uniref:Peptidase C51 domain-containing protein n=1 Tax=Candidatus Magasanikbacteria bacterium CG10_big_fil_rev_8_21_14_0_10_36_32 TaxID=1974646 RepID=A0A2M6W7R5_9BACT|nr:MAG: hypothetical protein COU29_00400 [Candidatus Magasanikbacteria bacterium CG10_big_fil_rev_8_21_14_0_10_36_32]
MDTLLQLILKIFKSIFKQNKNINITPNSQSDIKVISEKLSPVKNNVVIKDGYPILKDKQRYPATDPDTKKIRNILKEQKKGLEFFDSDDEITDLQCTEYVSFRLLREEITIDWSKRNGRRRDGKNWPEILKDTYEVNEIAAKGAAISSPATEKNIFGHIAYVEEASAEGFIIISDANSDDKGIYRASERKNPDTKGIYKNIEGQNVKFIHFEKKFN